MFNSRHFVSFSTKTSFFRNDEIGMRCFVKYLICKCKCWWPRIHSVRSKLSSSFYETMVTRGFESEVVHMAWLLSHGLPEPSSMTWGSLIWVPKPPNIKVSSRACKWLMQLWAVCSHSFSGIIWHNATETSAIQMHASFVMALLENISLDSGL